MTPTKTKRHAFFDVDNTIYNGYTASELLFYLVKEKSSPQRLTDEFKKLANKYQKGEINYATITEGTLNLFSESLQGKTVDYVSQTVKDLLQRKTQIFFEWVKPVIDHLRENNFEITLVSAGPDTVVKEVSELLDANNVFATKILTQNGIFTGQNPHILNEHEKVKIIDELTGKQKDYFSVGFGDSTGDIHMLELMNHAFVLKNDHHPDMMRISRERNWTIFDNAETVIEKLEKIVL
ncbi:HAD-IB family phosphatase [Candidatus Dojkabacteria bacterium]|nr:HAD-IB family phosphatase [Candidatus Dojkabacteria bacterium]